MNAAGLLRRLAVLAILALAGLLGGCAQQQQVVLHDAARVLPGPPRTFAAASPSQLAEGVLITRAGQALPARAGLVLMEGDVIESRPGMAAVIRFPDGHEATLLPATRVRIGSIFTEIGETVVRVFKQVQGRFRVKTQYVTAGVEGTEFWVRVDAAGRQSFGLIEGRISLSSSEDLWAPVVLAPGEVVTAVGRAPPVKDLRQRAEVDAIVDLMRRGFRGAPRPPALPVRPP